jgi:hypothetical protein
MDLPKLKFCFQGLGVILVIEEHNKLNTWLKVRWKNRKTYQNYLYEFIPQTWSCTFYLEYRFDLNDVQYFHSILFMIVPWDK